MENNSSQSEQSLIESLQDAKSRSLAKRCLNHIIKNKLEIEIDNYKLFINDDVLTRFLIARESDESKALTMWSQWADWKIQYKPEKTLRKDIANELRSGKAFLHGYDREGRPCIVVKNCKHIPENTNMEEFIRFFINLIDNACKLADE